MSAREKWEFTHPDGWTVEFEANDGAVDVSPEAIMELYLRRTVGQDAPEYSDSDPAAAARRGVFGYEHGTSLDEIKKNRGLSHTAVMVQVPSNGPAGVTPWMAGGGSTLRGVPEKDSVKFDE